MCISIEHVKTVTDFAREHEYMIYSFSLWPESIHMAALRRHSWHSVSTKPIDSQNKKKLTDRWANIHISYIVHAQQSFERLSAPRDSPLSAGVNQLQQRAHCQLEMQGARTHSRDSRGILTFDFSFAYFLFLFTRIDTDNCYDLFYRLQISIVIPNRYSTIFVISTKLLAYYIFILGLFVYVLHTYYI